jgi:hypothetical protein
MTPVRPLVGAVLCCLGVAAPAQAQLAFTGGLEYSTGDYGQPSDTDEWALPLGVRYTPGRWTLRATVSLLRVEGVASELQREVQVAAADIDDDGDIDDDDDDEIDDDDDDGGAGGPGAGAGGGSPPVRTSDQTQSGLGDAYLSAMYTLLQPGVAPVGLDVGGRVKLPVSNASQCLLTNGEIDYSAEAIAYLPVGRFEPSVTAGWTKRGDPQRRDIDCDAVHGEQVDLRNPFYFVLGLGIRLTAATSTEFRYLYREELLDGSDPVSRLRVALHQRFGDRWRASLFGSAGFTDASPDWSLGASLAWRY